MAISNRDRVERVMEILRDGLGPYVLREYKTAFGNNYAAEIDDALATGAYRLPDKVFKSEQALLAALDVQNCLNLMARRWNEVFRKRLGKAERGYVGELQEARNAWAHQKAFSNDEAYRVADTAERLLKAISAPEHAARVQEIGQELLRLRYEAEKKKAKKGTGPLEAQGAATLPGLKAWRYVVEPHRDVATGRYIQARFAADLAEVLEGRADPEYQDPIEFFRRTYLTDGLLNLVINGLNRLTAQGGDPVVQLQTSFGGGKTHSMLALYHLAGAKIRKLGEVPGGERIVERIGDIDPPEASRAVLVGTALDPTKPREYPDATVHTLWGELAYQIGGAEGCQMVAKADTTGVSPGANTLWELMDRFGPCLIIIDELVAYARNVYGVSGLPAGSFDAIMTFVQALTEAVKRSTDSLLLVAIPESDIEIGGEGGRRTLDMLANVIGRVESVWKPVTASESFEIVRRRLFTDKIDYPARDAVLSEYSKMYRRNADDFPTGVGEQEYLERMRAAYPIHPELFERLYQDWSTLERFQRTRGVLRLMAAVIHHLWHTEDHSLLIMPGSVPIYADAVRDELLRYLPEGWPAIVDTDIDGPDSRPYALDNSVPVLGKHAASRRVARSVFIGSAPSVAGQAVRGVEEVRIRLATVQPGEPVAVFGDALRRMSNQLTYLYSDGSRYWYDTRPTVNRLAKDRAQHFSEDEVERTIIERLRRIRRSNDFAAAHVGPESSADVADEQRVRVVVLRPGQTHKRNGKKSSALQAAQEIFEQRGNAPRLYRNMLVFIATDQGDADALKQAVREYLAWQSIHAQEEQLNLDAQQRKQVQVHLKQSDENVDLRLQTAYSWLLVPEQPEPLGDIEWAAHRISGEDNLYDRAARRLYKDGLLIKEWSPDMLRRTLDQYLWRDKDHIGLKPLWDYLSSYCYLPRLRDRDVLLASISEGIGRLANVDVPFAYATGFDEATGRYTGLALRQHATIYFDDSSVLVRPEVAQQQIEAGKQEEAGVPDSKPRGKKPGRETSGGTPPPPAVFTRYHGDVAINPQRIIREVSTIVDEVIQHLTGLPGCEVEITLEISARYPEGFDENLRRTVSENSRTLKFRHHGFEQE